MKDVIQRDGGNIIIMFWGLICSVVDSFMCVNIGVSVMEKRDRVGRDYNSHQTGSYVLLVKGRSVCAASMCLESPLYMDHRF